MSDITLQQSLKQRWLYQWQHRRFLKNQLRHSLHPRQLTLFLQSLLHSHHYIAQHAIKRQALSALPLCLVIGEAGVGKSSLLDNSGLHFYNHEAINSRYQPMAGRTMPQFRHTAHKLFVELPTYLFINESNKHIPYFEQVLAFFQRFDYFHNTREILYTISLEKLLSQDELVLKQRDEFFANLSVLLTKIPHNVQVHIALTMTDRLLGFSEFFDDLSIEERQLACGISLHQAPLTETFQRQFQHLAQRLTERLFWRCNGESQLKRRLLVANFPQQFIHAEQSLAALMQRFHELAEVLPALKVRGLYWLSNVQQGHLIDLLNQQRIAWRDHHTSHNLPLLLQRKAFFVRGFFQHVNVAHLGKAPVKAAVKTKKQSTPPRRWPKLSLWLAGGLLAIAIAGSVAYTAYQQHLSNAVWQPLQHDPALAYTLLTANDPRQAVQAYLSHAAPNLSDSRQHSFIDDPDVQAQLQQLASGYVQQAWQNQVLDYYQQHLAGRYPIDPRAKTDVDLKTFTDFYGPQGVLDRFQSEYLNHSPRWPAQPPVFFERVQRLQHLLFNTSKGMSVMFSLSLDQLGPDIRQMDLNFAGTPLTLKAKAIVNGEFYWPNNANIQQSSYVIQKTHGPLQSFNRTGPWNWLALLQQFHGEHFARGASGRYEGDWLLNNADVRLHISSPKDINALVTLFSTLTPPESLL